MPNRVPAWRVFGESAVENRFEALHPRAARRRWLGVRRRSNCCSGAGSEPRAARVRLYCFRASRALASRASPLRSRSGSRASRTPDCAISARRTTRTAHSTQPSRSWNAPPGSAREDTPEIKLTKLEALLAATQPSNEDMALLAELLSIAGRRPTVTRPQISRPSARRNRRSKRCCGSSRCSRGNGRC